VHADRLCALRAFANRVLGLILKFFRCCRFVLAVLSVAAATAGAESARSYAVVAMAADVQTMVVRDSEGRLVSCARGDVVAGTEWRVVNVRGGSATLEGVQRQAGAKVELRVNVGERFDPHVPLTTHESVAAPLGSARILPTVRQGMK